MSSWIANLPLRHKFALLCGVALVMAGAPTALVLRDSLGNLQALRAESAGLGPSEAMLAIIKLTQEHRGLSAAMLNGDASKQADRQDRQAKLDQSIAALREEVAALHDSGLIKDAEAMRQAWQALAGDVAAARIGAPDSLARHTQLVNQELAFLEDVVGNTGLALDADAECYYLITAAFQNLPRLTEKLGLARARGTTILARRSASPEQRQALLTAADGVQLHAEDVRRGIEKSGVLNGPEGAQLGPRLQEANAALTQARSLVDSLANADDLSGMSTASYFQGMSASIAAQFAVSEQLVGTLDKLLADRTATQARNLGLTISMVLLMSGLGAWLAITITRLTTRTVADALRVADALAAGDLSQTMHSTHNDEVGQLVRAMGQAITQLRQTIVGIKSASASVATASEQIAQGNVDLSARTENQAASLQQTASSMEQMSATVSHNASTAQSANQLASQASVEALRSGETFAQVVSKMAAIQQASRKIADINAVIDGIAFQTNILALNAAVEAARAGEQGRGFAVVATEVRSLAGRSAEAAREIKRLISNSTESVEAGYSLATETGHSIERLVTQVQQVSQLMAEIASGSEQQHLGISQVNQAVNQLDQATQQNAALVEESGAAASSLSDQAARLEQAVGAFKLA